jgi:hypothetical protein
MESYLVGIHGNTICWESNTELVVVLANWCSFAYLILLII